jgi:hypothetical protein
MKILKIVDLTDRKIDVCQVKMLRMLIGSEISGQIKSKLRLESWWMVKSRIWNQSYEKINQ